MSKMKEWFLAWRRKRRGRGNWQCMTRDARGWYCVRCRNHPGGHRNVSRLWEV